MNRAHTGRTLEDHALLASRQKGGLSRAVRWSVERTADALVTLAAEHVPTLGQRSYACCCGKTQATANPKGSWRAHLRAVAIYGVDAEPTATIGVDYSELELRIASHGLCEDPECPYTGNHFVSEHST